MRRDRIAVLAFVAVVAACSSQQTVIQPVPSENKSTVKENPEETKKHAAEVWVQLGQHYLELGKYEIAKEDLLKALKFDPKSVDAHTVLATLYDRVGDRTSAEEQYRIAAELAPTAGATNNNYGLYLCKLGRFDQAQKRFDIAKADGFYKDRDVIYLNAGTCQLLGKGPVDLAEADFRRAVEINPNNGQALYQLASVLYDKGDFFKARAYVQRFEAIGQASPDALLLARNIEVKLGNAGAAGEYAKRLREQFPESAQAHALEGTTSSQ
jgi:type IV pilus assembly protein PilF